MDDFKVVTLFLVLGITVCSFVPVTSNYGFYQPQYFRVPPLQHPYSPYGFQDIYRVNPVLRTVPSVFPTVPPNRQPPYPQPPVPTVYNYYGTPVYDYRFPAPFHPGRRPVFPPPPSPFGPFDPYDPFDPSDPSDPPKGKPNKNDDGIEKLDNKDKKKKDKKPKQPEKSEDTTEPSEDTTEPTEDTVTVDALD